MGTVEMAHTQRTTQSQRLDRIEEKIDKLSEVLTSMARAEEKITNLSNDHDKMYERINRLSTKLDDIEHRVIKNSQTTQTVHKLFWVAIAAASAAIANQAFNWF